MHHCLNIDEILLKLIGHVEQSSSLYSLTLVCRAFYKLANEGLWADLPGLSPLVKCLPDYLIAPSDDYGDTLTVVRPPLPSEWENFRRHARLVKSLQVSLQGDDQFAVDSDALEILARENTGPLLPNLEELVWNNWRLAEYAPLFVQPSLVVLEFTPSGFDELRALFDRIVSSAPQLETFILADDMREIMEGLEPEFTRTITSLEHLTALDFDYIELPLDAFLHVSQLPEFTSLSLYLTPKHRDLRRSSSWGGLHALQRLSLMTSYTAESCVRIAAFLDSLSGAKLTHLEIKLHPPSHAGDFTWLIAALGRLRKLTCLTISFDRRPLSDWGEIILDGDALAPLHKIPSMLDVSLANVPISFSPDAVRGFTTAWRFLRHFALASQPRGPCHMRLEDLAHFSRNCPVLETLDVRIHPVDADWTCDTDLPWSLSALSTLDLQRSRIASPAAPHVAMYLAKIFQVAKVDHSFPTRKTRWLGEEPPAEELMAGKIIRTIANQKDKLVPDVFKRSLAAREDIFEGDVLERWR